MGAQTLVLWDVDHTLMETGGVGFELFRTAFEQASGQELVHPADVTGRTEPAIFRKTLELQGIPYNTALFDRYAECLATGYRASRGKLVRRGRALPGAAEAIAALSRTGSVVQSVLTGNLRPVAETKLRTFGLDGGLDLEVGAYGTDDELRANLVPVACRRAAQKYQTPFPAHATVLIGDSPSDVQAALDNGVRIIAVASGKSSPNDLRSAGATVVLPSLMDAHGVVRTVLNSNRQP
ncbi:MAG TPA: haloacid dehalogenase-like hydrolase [Streptosporangiaceae bacterium]